QQRTTGEVVQRDLAAGHGWQGEVRGRRAYAEAAAAHAVGGGRLQLVHAPAQQFQGPQLWWAASRQPPAGTKRPPRRPPPPARVARRASTRMSRLARRKCTEPSANRKLAPPGWKPYG